ncbi:MAG TPA: hypothetical protein VKV77_08345 [Methylovirgula sp.]|nr:hypothetical protein [Methylovirgula sp.]
MRRAAIFTGAFFGALLTLAAPALIYRCAADWVAQAEFSKFAARVPGLTGKVIAGAETVTITNLAYRGQGVELRIGRIVLPLRTPGLLTSSAYATESGKGGQWTAPTGGSVSAENIELAAGGIHYSIKSVTLSGTDLTKSELDSIFDPGNSLSLYNRIEKISAAQVTIPEITADFTLNNESEKTTYKDVVLNEVAQGRASEAAIDSAVSNVDSPQGSMQSTFGPIKVKSFDLALLARFVSETRSDDAQPRQTLYQSLEISGGRMSFGTQHAEVDVGLMSESDVKVRPLRTPPISLAKLVGGSDSSSNQQQIIAFLSDMLESYEIGALDISDFQMTIGEKDNQAHAALGHIRLSQMADSKIGEIGFENFTVEGSDAKIKLGSFAMHGIDFKALFETAESAAGLREPADHPPSIIEKISLAGLDVGLANPEAHVQLADLGLSGDDPVDGFPSHFASNMDHLLLDLKNAAIAKQFSELVSLGYDKLDVSSKIDAHFDAAKRELGVNELSLTGADMGAVKVSGNLGNVSKDLFSTDEAHMEAAALSILIQRLELRIENAGFLERFLASVAKENNKSLEETRQAYEEAAATKIPELLGGGASAKAVGAAVAKFIARPKNLRIVAVAPDGIGALEFALVKDPNALMDKVSIVATVDE